MGFEEIEIDAKWSTDNSKNSMDDDDDDDDDDDEV